MVEDNTTPTPYRGGGINPAAKPACGNMHEHSQAIEHTRHASTIRSPSRQDTPTPHGIGCN